MKKLCIGVIIGVALSTTFFLIKDLVAIETTIPKNHVVLRLILDTERPIDRIVLTSTYSTQAIELTNQTKTLLIYPNPGEGEFKVCCSFKDGKKICSQEQYVEGGYSPTLIIKEEEIETINFF